MGITSYLTPKKNYSNQRIVVYCEKPLNEGIERTSGLSVESNMKVLGKMMSKISKE